MAEGRAELERVAMRIAGRIADGEIQDGMGYFVAVFWMTPQTHDGKSGTWVGHATNANAKEAVRALRDLAENLEADHD